MHHKLHRRARQSATSALLALLALRSASSLRAQGTPAAPSVERDMSAVCLGFAFGSWAPPLDWHAARQQGTMDSSFVGHGAGGRGLAAGDEATTDSSLMLFPGWWPVGVSVALPTRSPAAGDTVTGVATALVADGRVHNPTAKVRAWRVRCGEPNRSGATIPSTDTAPHRRATSRSH